MAFLEASCRRVLIPRERFLAHGDDLRTSPAIAMKLFLDAQCPSTCAHVHLLSGERAVRPLAIYASHPEPIAFVPPNSGALPRGSVAGSSSQNPGQRTGELVPRPLRAPALRQVHVPLPGPVERSQPVHQSLPYGHTATQQAHAVVLKVLPVGLAPTLLEPVAGRPTQHLPHKEWT